MSTYKRHTPLRHCNNAPVKRLMWIKSKVFVLSHETSSSSPLASSLLSELAHKLTPAGCRQEQSGRFMQRSLTRRQWCPLKSKLLPLSYTSGESDFGLWADACPLRVSAQLGRVCCWDKRKEASHCAWSTERYYVIGKWIALCMPGQCLRGSAALRTCSS